MDYADKATGRVVSRKWNSLDQATRDELTGYGKIISMAVPPAKVRGLAAIKETDRTATGIRGIRGTKGFELHNAQYQKVRNKATSINGREFSGHALDQMQNRGIMPSTVENAIKSGQVFPTRIGTTGFYDSTNNMRVITDTETGRIVTVIRGRPE